MRILDVCCGPKMFWWNKNEPHTTYIDNREIKTTLCDGRQLIVNPDVVADFRNLPFKDKQFNLVVFDPPHLLKVGENSWLAKKYGKLSSSWKSDLKQGFDECIRVLDDNGVLVFKWSEQDIKTNEVLKVFGRNPIFGDKRSKTRWLIFIKSECDDDIL